MSTLPAVIYMMLMLYAYGSQIRKLYLTKDPSGVSFSYFSFALMAVALRIAQTGIVIMQTWNFAAICLEVAEITVLVGLIIVVSQIIYYRRKRGG